MAKEIPWLNSKNHSNNFQITVVHCLLLYWQITLTLARDPSTQHHGLSRHEAIRATTSYSRNFGTYAAILVDSNHAASMQRKLCHQITPKQTYPCLPLSCSSLSVCHDSTAALVAGFCFIPVIAGCNRTSSRTQRMVQISRTVSFIHLQGQTSARTEMQSRGTIH